MWPFWKLLFIIQSLYKQDIHQEADKYGYMLWVLLMNTDMCLVWHGQWSWIVDLPVCICIFIALKERMSYFTSKNQNKQNSHGDHFQDLQKCHPSVRSAKRQSLFHGWSSVLIFVLSFVWLHQKYPLVKYVSSNFERKQTVNWCFYTVMPLISKPSNAKVTNPSFSKVTSTGFRIGKYFSKILIFHLNQRSFQVLPLSFSP